MGWITNRCHKTGGSLYSGGPKRKGPLRKVLHILHYGMGSMFGKNFVLLECGHVATSYGGEKAICPKCKAGKPIDDIGPTWGLENPVKQFTPNPKPQDVM